MKYKKTFIFLLLITLITGQLHGGWDGITDTDFNLMMFIIHIISATAGLVLVFSQPKR